MFNAKKILAGIMAATVLSASTVISTYAASSESWYLQTVQGAPSSVERTSYQGELTNLIRYDNPGYSTGVNFKCTEYSDPLATSTKKIKAVGDLVDASLKEYPGQKVTMSSKGANGSIMFQMYWYDVCGGTVEYTIKGENFVSGKNQRISGTTSGYHG